MLRCDCVFTIEMYGWCRVDPILESFLGFSRFKGAVRASYVVQRTSGNVLRQLSLLSSRFMHD